MRLERRAKRSPSPKSKVLASLFSAGGLFVARSGAPFTIRIIDDLFLLKLALLILSLFFLFSSFCYSSLVLFEKLYIAMVLK